jgi:CxxC motif-containing protein (DUF1111 family)
MPYCCTYHYQGICTPTGCNHETEQSVRMALVTWKSALGQRATPLPMVWHRVWATLSTVVSVHRHHWPCGKDRFTMENGNTMNSKRSVVVFLILALLLSLLLHTHTVTSQSAFLAQDPGVRGGPAGAGDPIAGLSPTQLAFFNAGRDEFVAVEEVADGLGPRMNLDACGGCHAQPMVGGTSPAVNPQVAFATTNGATNSLPSFITADGPVREARFVSNPDGSPDGGVHNLFTIAGRADARGCILAQPDFARELASNNVIFRIPTPVFGAGLIEQIPDREIMTNLDGNATQKNTMGIGGRPNIILAGSTITGQANLNGNDGTIARFGWKAQDKSLLLFAGEAYNVEMGITNELFQTEREEAPACQFATVPNDVTNTDAVTSLEALSAIEKFAFFMRFLAPPTPSPDTPGGSRSITRGQRLFSDIGCALCHTPTLHTGNATVAALRNQPVHLFSDLLLHFMGPGLADGVTQGQAGPGEFRTAPLWGVGQRIFLLHDGRTTDLLAAIQAHQSGSSGTSDASEANAVIQTFSDLPEPQKQDILNFLRSL